MDTDVNAPQAAAIYTRVSTAGQADDSAASLYEQLADCEAYAEARGLEVVAHFQDVAAGTNPNRPQFRLMLEDARRLKFDVILVWRGDRLNRGISSAGRVDEVLRERDALGAPLALLSVKDNIDARIFGVLAWAAGEEAKAIAQRSVMGKNAAARAGRLPSGACPFGYRIGEDGRPVVHEQEAAIVRRIFDSYEAGVSVKLIALEAGALGYPIHENRVHEILRQTAYKGYQVYGATKRVRVRGTSRLVTQPPESHIEIPYPPIIEAADWERIQALKAEKRFFAKRATKRFYLAAKLVRCHCGNMMSPLTKPARGPNSQPIAYYRCRGAKQGLRCRPKSYVRADVLEPALWGEVQAMLTDPEQFFDVLDADNAGAELDAALEDARRGLAKIQREEERLVRLYITEQIDDAMLAKQRRYITERLEHAEEQVETLHRQRQVEQDRAEMVDTITAWAARIQDGIATLDAEAKREIMTEVIDSATLSRENVLTVNFVVALDQETLACRWATSMPTTRRTRWKWCPRASE